MKKHLSGKFKRLQILMIFTASPTYTLMDNEQLIKEIAELEAKLTGDMFSDMEIKDQIHNLEMKLHGVKPMDSHFDCVGCGS